MRACAQTRGKGSRIRLVRSATKSTVFSCSRGSASSFSTIGAAIPSTLLTRGVQTPCRQRPCSTDTDLLSRGVEYGYRGSAFTALIYAANFIMYSGFETAYLASAIHDYWDALPL